MLGQVLGDGSEAAVPPFSAVQQAISGEASGHAPATSADLVAWRQAFRERLGRVSRLEQVC